MSRAGRFSYNQFLEYEFELLELWFIARFVVPKGSPPPRCGGEATICQEPTHASCYIYADSRRRGGRELDFDLLICWHNCWHVGTLGTLTCRLFVCLLVSWLLAVLHTPSSDCVLELVIRKCVDM